MRLLLLVLENIGHRCLELADTWRERYGEDTPEYLMERARRVWELPEWIEKRDVEAGGGR